jgi:hypothetical protein
LGEHLVDELVGKGFTEDLPESGFVLLQLCFGRQDHIATPAELAQPRGRFLSNFVACGIKGLFTLLFAGGRRQQAHRLALFIRQTSSLKSCDVPVSWHNLCPLSFS